MTEIFLFSFSLLSFLYSHVLRISLSSRSVALDGTMMRPLTLDSASLPRGFIRICYKMSSRASPLV